MKSTLTLCAVLLSGSMFVAAQQPAASPSASTPPTFPTDQKAPVPDRPQSTLPPDANSSSTSTQTSTSDQDSVAPKTIDGCLSQAAAGNGFVLTDQSGIAYNLQGDSSMISSHIGQQVSVTGAVTKSSASSSVSNTDNPDSKNSSTTGASDSHSTKSSESVIAVSKLDKIADTCSNSQAPSK